MSVPIYYSFKDITNQNIIALQQESVNLKIRLDRMKVAASEAHGKVSAMLTEGVRSGRYAQNVTSGITTGRDTLSTQEVLGLASALEEAERLEALYERANGSMKGRHHEFARMIDKLSDMDSSLKRFFMGKNKKLEYEKLYNDLTYMLYQGAGKEITAFYSQVTSGRISPQETMSRLGTAPGEYRKKLQKYIDELSVKPGAPEAISRLISQLKEIYVPESLLTSFEKKLEDEIVSAVDQYREKEAYDIMADLPIETINKGEAHFKLALLKEEGMEKFSDLYNVTAYRLGNIKGITKESGEKILAAVKEKAATVKNQVRLKLTADNKTEETGLIVRKISEYLDAQAPLSKLKEEKKNAASAGKAGNHLASMAFSTDWMFLQPAQKSQFMRSYRDLYYLLQGEYASVTKENRYILGGVKEVTGEEAWERFSKDPISYISVIEKLIPGMLGEDSDDHGLTEELIEEISQETIDESGLKCSLRRYQEWGVKYILHQKKVLLGDEMGLGKTVQAIASMVALSAGGAKHFCVICPASVLSNWCREIEKHSVLLPIKVHGPKRDAEFERWTKEGGVCVTTFETISRLLFPEEFTYSMLVVDEAHYIKNASAIRSQFARKFAERADRILFMTGTALENKTSEMVALISMLDPEISKKIEHMEDMTQAQEYREVIAPVYYRRKRDEVLSELPDKIETQEWCTLEGEEKKLYEKAVMNDEFVKSRRVSFMVDDLKDSSKARRMMEIIEEAKEDERKILIFSFFLDTIKKISEHLGDRCSGVITGSVSPEKRQEILDEFDKAPAGSCLVAQIQAGGTGLNIQSASVVIICEPQYKPSIENQAISRSYRMGQARSVMVHRLLCEKSVDERMTELLANKQAIFDAFADKSKAAASDLSGKTIEENAEGMNDESFRKIIEEEKERIRKESQEITGGS